MGYTFKLKNTVTLAEQTIPVTGLLSKTNGDRTFEVSSTTPAHVGTYEVIVEATTPVGKMAPPVSDQLKIALEVTNECQTDVVTPTATISDRDFIIGQSTKAEFTYAPTWSTTVSGCPFTYEVRRVVAAVDQALTAHETAALTFSAADGSFDIYTTDISLDSEVWTLKVFKRSTYALQPGQDGIYQFDITFID